MSVDEAELERRMARYVEVSRRAGLKLTHQRLEIFRELAASVEHPDAETVYQGVRRRVPTVSLDTVYRTLWRMHDLGLITTLFPRQDSLRFDANVGQHHHFVCTACGLARDFESEELDSLAVPDEASELGQAQSAQVIIKGLCANCATARSANQARE